MRLMSPLLHQLSYTATVSISMELLRPAATLQDDECPPNAHQVHRDAGSDGAQATSFPPQSVALFSQCGSADRLNRFYARTWPSPLFEERPRHSNDMTSPSRMPHQYPIVTGILASAGSKLRTLRNSCQVRLPVSLDHPASKTRVPPPSVEERAPIVFF
jgi:hypothetical protein